MARRVQAVRSEVPKAALAAFRSLSRQPVLEQIVTPHFVASFERWMNDVARQAAMKYPKQSGRSASEIYGAARVRGSGSLSTLHGYFLVSPAVFAHEYGAEIDPINATKLAIPLPAACYPDGRPRRRGPESWRSLGTFAFTSKTNGNSYIGYKSKTTGRLVHLYLLVDHVTIKPKRVLRNAFDELQPKLFAEWSAILQRQIARVYSEQYDAIVAKSKGTVPRRHTGPLPSSAGYASSLMPRYKK